MTALAGLRGRLHGYRLITQNVSISASVSAEWMHGNKTRRAKTGINMECPTIVLMGWCFFVGQVATTRAARFNDGHTFHLQLAHLANDVMGLQEMQVSCFCKLL